MRCFAGRILLVALQRVKGSAVHETVLVVLLGHGEDPCVNGD